VTDDDDTAPCDRSPLIARTTRLAYRSEDQGSGVPEVRVMVTEELTVSDDRRDIIGSALGWAALEVTVRDSDGACGRVVIPLDDLETADRITDALDAFRALHHLHVGLAEQRAANKQLADAAGKAERFAASWDDPLPPTGPEAVAARLREAVAVRLADEPLTPDTGGGWITGATGSGKSTSGDYLREPNG